MTIPARLILAHVPEGLDEFSLRQGDGSPVGLISRSELEVLIEEDMVCAKARGKRVRWVELLVPLGAARRALGDNKASVRSQASQTTLKQLMESTRTQIFQHHKQRCFAWPR